MLSLRNILTAVFLVVGIVLLFFDYDKGIGTLTVAVLLDIADSLDK